MTETDKATFVAGSPFEVLVPCHMEIEDVRIQIRTAHNLEPHFQVKVGPTVTEGNTLHSQIAAVDDPYLNLQINCRLPDSLHYLLLGYFKTLN